MRTFGDLFTPRQLLALTVLRTCVERARGAPGQGATVLDRVHQAMILFGAGRGEALRRFLVDDGAGQDPRLWNLADHLCKLYPAGSDEKRWVDGLLGRKKGLGF